MFFLLDKIDFKGRSCSFITTSQIPGTTTTNENSNKNNRKFDSIPSKRSIGFAFGLGSSVGKKGIIGNWPKTLKKIKINEPNI